MAEKSIHVYFRVSQDMRKKLECLKKEFGHNHLSETIRFLITLGLQHVDKTFLDRCQKAS